MRMALRRRARRRSAPVTQHKKRLLARELQLFPLSRPCLLPPWCDTQAKHQAARPSPPAAPPLATRPWRLPRALPSGPNPCISRGPPAPPPRRTAPRLGRPPLLCLLCSPLRGGDTQQQPPANLSPHRPDRARDPLRMGPAFPAPTRSSAAQRPSGARLALARPRGPRRPCQHRRRGLRHAAPRAAPPSPWPPLHAPRGPHPRAGAPTLSCAHGPTHAPRWNPAPPPLPRLASPSLNPTRGFCIGLARTPPRCLASAACTAAGHRTRLFRARVRRPHRTSFSLLSIAHALHPRPRPCTPPHSARPALATHTTCCLDPILHWARPRRPPPPCRSVHRGRSCIAPCSPAAARPRLMHPNSHLSGGLPKPRTLLTAPTSLLGHPARPLALLFCTPLSWRRLSDVTNRQSLMRDTLA